MAGVPLTYPPFEHWVWFIPVVMLGLCVGSFLNVVIYRLPKGMSVNQPRRSFCPGCKNQLRAMQNLPVISWLCLGGKCGFCGVPISVRYVAVEILTAVLFGLVWWIFPPQVALPLWVLMALLVAITFIDAEHLIIPTNLTWAGAVVGLIGGVAWPPLSALAGYNFTRLDGLKAGGIGWIVGFVGLWGVVEFGKKDRRAHV